MTGSLKILVVHDYPLAYQGAHCVLTRLDCIETVAEARDGSHALLRCTEDRPDVVVIDASVPQKRVADVIGQLTDLCNEVRFVVIAEGATPYAIRHALLLPAQGFVARDAPASELADAVCTVAAGDHYVTPLWTEHLVEIMRHLPGEPHLAVDAGFEELSQREREVFRMLAAGMTNKEIAFALQIGRKTVEKHHLHVLRKLGLTDSIDLIRYAARIGFIDLDHWVSS